MLLKFFLLACSMWTINQALVSESQESSITLSPTSIVIEVNGSAGFNITTTFAVEEPVILLPVSTSPRIASIPGLVIWPANKTTLRIDVTPNNPGSCVVYFNDTSRELEGLTQAFVPVEVVKHGWLNVISAVVGWAYFAAWSISFYPQAILNYRRKSVVGMSFDLFAYTTLGYVTYGAYNVGMYWIPAVLDEYQESHPHGVNPVQLNDVMFTLHGLVLSVVVLIQIALYERGGQKLSKVCIVLTVASTILSLVGLVITLSTDYISILNYLLYISYIKLGVTLRYIPQMYLNCKLKSTAGWSVGSVLYDLAGGILSLLQMLLIAYNYDDWGSIVGDPTKFGLGLLTIVFDVVFIVQHYLLFGGSTGGVSNIKDKDRYEKVAKGTDTCTECELVETKVTAF
ncbi:cystinosin homolog isoform X1 [Ptychodera flava]|uniref:cystinosin homolog isoform X1 n=1 Tax=Ptychodera flava TaxID=63121 RepID=UPI00396A60CC